MGNHCDIYNVTLAACTEKTEAGGLYYEQKIYKRIFQNQIGEQRDSTHFTDPESRLRI